MDLMDVRREMMGVIAAMAGSGHVRMASGEFTLESATTTVNIQHNLGTSKLFAIMQRVNSDHSNIDSSVRYQDVFVFGCTREGLDLDMTQTYSYNGGNQNSFVDSSSVNGYPAATRAYFGNTSDTVLTMGVLMRSTVGFFAIDNNTLRLVSGYNMNPGRWIYRIYALD